MKNRQIKPTISELVLAPVLWAWGAAAILSFLLGVMAVQNELEKTFDIEREKLKLLLAPVTRSIEGEIMLGSSGVVEIVKDILKTQHGLSSIHLDSVTSSSCIGGKNNFVSLFSQNADICVSGPISSPGPHKNIVLAKRITTETTLTIFKAITLTSLPFLALASLVFWIVTKKLKNHVIDPLADLEQNQLENVSKFLKDEIQSKLTLPVSSCRELDHLFRILESNALQLKSSLEERRLLEVKHMQARAIAGTVQMVSHDVRRPLSLAKSIMDLFTDCKSISEMHALLRNFKPEIDQAFLSINGTLSDLLLAGGEPQIVKEDVSISDMLDSALRSVLIEFPDLKNRVKIVRSTVKCWKLDRIKVLRVLGNLLTNAAQAVQNSNGTIEMRTAIVGGSLSIEIENTGSHIPESQMPKIFDQFFTSGKAGGTGLGLSIVKKVVEVHGGSVECESSSEMNQVNFRILIPT